MPFCDNDPSHKELYDMGGTIDLVSTENLKHSLYEETPFVPDAEHQWILEAFKKQYNAMHAVAMRLIELIAIGLGKERTFFNDWFERDSLSTYRAIHYLPRSAGVVNSSRLDSDQFRLTTPEHHDSGFLTLLTTFGYPGLQVEMADGEFKSILPVHNQIVVNLGYTISRITNYKLKATKHRVLDIGVERFSSPFFFDPKYPAVIPSNLI